MQETEPRKWLRLSAVARDLGIGYTTAHQMVVNGELKARRPTGNPRGWWQVDPEDFDRHKAKIAAGSQPNHAADATPSLTPTAA